MPEWKSKNRKIEKSKNRKIEKSKPGQGNWIAIIHAWSHGPSGHASCMGCMLHVAWLHDGGVVVGWWRLLPYHIMHWLTLAPKFVTLKLLVLMGTPLIPMIPTTNVGRSKGARGLHANAVFLSGFQNRYCFCLDCIDFIASFLPKLFCLVCALVFGSQHSNSDSFDHLLLCGPWTKVECDRVELHHNE